MQIRDRGAPVNHSGMAPQQPPHPPALSLREAWQRFTAWLRGVALGEPKSSDPAAAMFAGIQRRLLLWYAGVLALILVLAGIFLYAGMQQVLLGQVDSSLARNVQIVLTQSGGSCDLPDFGRIGIPYAACYDASGSLGAASRFALDTPPFLASSLAQRALTNGSASDTIDGGSGLGAIRRYAFAVRDSNGQLLGVIQVGESIAGQIQALSALLTLLLEVGALTLIGATLGGLFLARRALSPARLAFARQQQFIADASHELRTPLTLLRANAEVLLRGRGRLSADDVALLEDIVAETDHLAAIATSLLTLARLDAGAYHFEREVVSLAEVVDAVAHRVQALAAEKGIVIQQSATGPAQVVGDRRLLEQLALILVDNAIKYNRPGGRVTLRTYTAGREAFLETYDTGEGIPPEHLARLGERFYRVDKARSREAGGAGLGLSIARGIATAHGGGLQLASAPGQGTVAVVRLPAASNLASLPPGAV
jgi:signal transduction histidine kinase